MPSKHTCLFVPLFLCLAIPAGAESGRDSEPIRPLAPVFSLPTETGTVALDSLRGSVVLLDFWASWCGPCQKSFPWLGSMQARYGAKGLRIVAVNLDKSRGSALEFLEKHPASFTVAFDPSGKTARAFRVAGMPTSVLIGPDGGILYTHPGFDPDRTGDLESRLEEALGS
jgi:thiol-disulfide isomerase/thioredoxin